MTGPTKINEDNLFPWLLGGSLLVSAVLGIVTAFAVSPRFGASLFVGGVLASANFVWLRRGLEATLQQHADRATRFAVLRYILRLAVMAVLLYLLIVHLGVNIFGLLIGLSALVLNITALSIYLSTRKGG